jgi:hypothetical protein
MVSYNMYHVGQIGYRFRVTSSLQWIAIETNYLKLGNIQMVGG